MPLPTTGPDTVWPPKEVTDANAAYRKWAAWWAGDPDQLAKVYAQSVGYPSAGVVGDRDRRGLMALLPRSFHGQAPGKGALKSAKLHIPLAADIATTSADLLFGESPVLVAGTDADTKKPLPGSQATPTQTALDLFMTAGLQAVLLEAAEIAAAFGGVYLRAGWDAEISDTPLFDAIPPDAAVPEFRSGRLTAVTFYRTLPAIGDGKTWRHLERHEPGRILHGLYCSGDDKTLGQRKDLKENPETAVFAAIAGPDGGVDTGAKGLTAEYVPNMRPNRKLRGSQLGRSDYDGVESVMDALDEAWSSWMRDLRLGKGRILVPEVYLDAQGRGQGALFDTEQEIFQQVNALPGGTQSGLAITNVQFAIRVAEHQQTCDSLTQEAVRGAGYSAQSFGMAGEAAATATEVVARERRSYTTRAKKINYFRPAIARLTKTALEVYAAKLAGKGVVALTPDVEWPDGVAVDPQALATTLQLLKAAEAASTRTRVEMLHPDWKDDRVDEETKLINGEGQPDAPEPPAFPGTAAAGVTAAGGPVPGTGPNGTPAPGGPPGSQPVGQPGGQRATSGMGQPPTGAARPAPAGSAVPGGRFARTGGR